MGDDLTQNLNASYRLGSVPRDRGHEMEKPAFATAPVKQPVVARVAWVRVVLARPRHAEEGGLSG
jgi:hypothetical protein